MNVMKMNHATVCDYKVKSYILISCGLGVLRLYAEILALRPVRNAHCPAREKGIIAAIS